MSGDNESVVKWSAAALSLLPAASLTGCSPSAEKGEPGGQAHADLSVVIRSPQLQGLCYAPASFRANGALKIDDLPASGTHIEKVTPDKIEELDRILSERHARVFESTVTLPVPRDSVLHDPFYLQLILFDCDYGLSGSQKGLYILSAARSLPFAEVRSHD